jgi:phosphatidylinositol 4-kinase B
MENFHIFKTDKKTIDTQKVAFSIWKNRTSAEYVSDFTETLRYFGWIDITKSNYNKFFYKLLTISRTILPFSIFDNSKFVDEKRVFNEIEFYLPQLAHLIIHLEVDWPSNSLERLAIILCQTSIHTALQLCFMFIAAMEDYQPENADGVANPNANLEYYLRCSRLLRDVECAVVFGSPSLSANYSKASVKPVSVDGLRIIDNAYVEKKNRTDEILLSSNREPAAIITQDGKEIIDLNSTPVQGILLYKREFRKSKFSTKSWKPRFFRVEQHILFCYKNESSTVPLRSLPIRDFELSVVNREKYQYQFELFSKSTGVKFQLRADSDANFESWVKGLKR